MITANEVKGGIKMIYKETLLECIKDPMQQYQKKMIDIIGNWRPLINASEKILAGEEVEIDKLPSTFHPMIKMMRAIVQVTKESKWDWSNPEIQNIYKDLAESELYKMFAEATVGIVSSIIQTVKIGTLVEIGTGPGLVTKSLCEEMLKNSIKIPLIVSDRAPSISATGENLRKAFPQLTINDFVWDIRENPPSELVERLIQPVLVFVRFSLPYGGYGAIDKIGPIADILIIVEDLNIAGKKEAYDIIFEKIGAQFFTYGEAKEHIEKHFSFLHSCDMDAVESINAPVTTFTLAMD